jgi:hypothetical protein
MLLRIANCPHSKRRRRMSVRKFDDHIPEIATVAFEFRPANDTVDARVFRKIIEKRAIDAPKYLFIAQGNRGYLN